MLIENVNLDFVKSERVNSKNNKPLHFLTIGKGYESEQLLCSNELDFTNIEVGTPLSLTLELKKDGFKFNAFVVDCTIAKQ